ncbi:hypothetical protein EIN_320450 [Entamoeba invadens IP1]|uniref:Uncharacterized protein n=1 Tax=Entamoeba invadens IP1 TaxID=370355 RepID=A0A0A1U5K0_ENTIV|nr:hypothetical protein EIN_320450 [Entamoeba invadens IP1]ELP87046.1 hypothetical protein EIN_320450 [Entamoeba invadens IP1]|eukprot:XP_004253817.1 hypothetical protein EIN_320450 [Entamoeba invadens IP1]
MYGLTIHWVIHKELLVYRLSACFVTSIFGVIGIIFHFFAIVMIFYNQKRYHKTRTIFLSLLVLEFITLTPFITITWVKGSQEELNINDFDEEHIHALETQFSCCYVNDHNIMSACDCLYQNRLTFTSVDEMVNDGTCAICGKQIKNNSNLFFKVTEILNSLLVVSDVILIVWYCYFALRRKIRKNKEVNEIEKRLKEIKIGSPQQTAEEMKKMEEEIHSTKKFIKKPIQIEMTEQNKMNTNDSNSQKNGIKTTETK